MGLQMYRMFWKLALPAILAWTLFVSTESKRPRPPGSIPSPYKLKGNDLSSPTHTLASLPQHTSARRQKGKHDMLSSSREALVVTERKYLKSDWCKTQPLRQTVSLEGCLSRTVINRFCYGQCNSFYIPRHLTSQTSHRSRKTSSMPDHNTSFQSCAFCRPSRITTVTVRLHCPGLQPPYRQRKVQRIKQCKCVSVNVNAAY
ncbi:gremlin-2-like [Carassius auratus]|uniref:Gremlin-2-like n=1 Tax=Carassius auratus TaxID=7957 RepID=A0A6P6P4K2_CARAU|nr:gremlin-2-like [Carassius auratus]XP_052427858.1 gremlin-2 [Carassius gibelio]XP_052475700.1 gremlin-2-like [Carassius gibelio]